MGDDNTEWKVVLCTYVGITVCTKENKFSWICSLGLFKFEISVGARGAPSRFESDRLGELLPQRILLGHWFV